MIKNRNNSKVYILISLISIIILFSASNLWAFSQNKFGMGYSADDAFGQRFGYLSLRYNFDKIFIEVDNGLKSSNEQIMSGIILKTGWYLRDMEKTISPYLGIGSGVLFLKNEVGYTGRIIIGLRINIKETLDLMVESGLGIELINKSRVIEVIGNSYPSLVLVYYLW